MNALLRSRSAGGVTTLLALCLYCAPQAVGQNEPFKKLGECNVRWETPSADCHGSMPIGNGDVAANVWWEAGGDLCLLIAKSDAWDDNARLVKVGKVRVQFAPNPVIGKKFSQLLDVASATVRFTLGEMPMATQVNVWVDANLPVIHIDVSAFQPISATAVVEPWRTQPEALAHTEIGDGNYEHNVPGNQHLPLIVEPDTFLTGQSGRIGWYHRNVKSIGPALSAELQDMADFKQPDPLLHRTFGAIVRADAALRIDDRTLRSVPDISHRFDIFVHTKHPATGEEWLAEVEQRIAEADATPFLQRRVAHVDWWRKFWERSWIFVSTPKGARGAAAFAANDHPVRVGVDQAGQNRFAGQIGRVSLFEYALSDAAVITLAALPRDQVAPAAGEPRFSVLDGAQPEPPLTALDLSRGLTVEAWIRPEQLPPGGARILDKTTPGGVDGFLFDTYPGNSLRLITRACTVTKRDCLPVGEWSHVAAVVDPARGEFRLMINGAVVAQQKQEIIDDGAVVSRAYALQRLITACAGRGAYPIKFNGSLFTVPHEGGPGGPDYRRWGAGYWWQNTRLTYVPLCTSGDFDLLAPLWRMYAGVHLPMALHRTRKVFGHGGAFLNECAYFWGAAFNESYGWTPLEKRECRENESRWHRWEWQGGIELVWMMLDEYDHTRDQTFLRETLLPFGREILTFYDLHYRDDERGRIVIQPAQALETWWDCTNPMPEIAGLRAVTQRLLDLPESAAAPAERELWKRLQRRLPDLPMRDVDGKRTLAPAERFDTKRNVENPELYAVFPYRQMAVGASDLAPALEALRRREDRGHNGWRQDVIFMAYLGLSDDAGAALVERARRFDAGERFPAFWGPNFDWTPDQCHGGVLMKTLQSMLIQTDGQRIFVAPAWPAEWNAAFRLYAPGQTIVEGEIAGGKITSLKVTPPERERDVVRMIGQ